MLRKTIRVIAIASLVLAYSIFIYNYSLHGLDSYFTQLFNAAWIFGIVSVISNAVYVILSDRNDDYLYWIGCPGLIWFVPFFYDIDSQYGIFAMIAYLLVIVFLHRDIFIRRRPS
ncbi:hypothetical protein POV27_07680 [Aureisphaera galaxeae]|uniref:hypothetical protein n=1 Tax=Aureisphaera galaxeae TaxID=1538023 RepID=UPI002350F804|nr:hypothetical protein [Aureisphaera galaxeae]MDC8003928.1 hypothetical protein [Aureisphaera galaxeae]